MPQIMIYKKLNFWEEYTPLLDTPWRGARYLGRTCATSRLHMCDRLPQLWHLIFFHLQYVSQHDHTVPLLIDLQSNPPHPLLQLLLLLASNPYLRRAQIASSVEPLSSCHLLYKVNRCLARYSPRVSTINQPTNRAPNEPARPGLKWPKMPSLVVFGQKILDFTGESKSFGTCITEKIT